MRVIEGETDAVFNVKLEDGTRIVLTVQILEISRIEGRVNIQGESEYSLDVNGQVRVLPPHLGRGTA